MSDKEWVVHNHDKLDIWHRSMALVVLVYKLTENLPDTERYGLVTQMRRAAVSAPSNISEGAAHDSPPAFRRYLRIAAGSLSELETQLMLAARLALASEGEIEKSLRETREIRRMTASLIRSLSD